MKLMNCRSFKERQECLSESLDNFSFEYPDLYSMLFREMKKRELEANDPHKIAKWLSTTQNSYAKLHESLILVKNHNLIAKEEYTNSIKHMICETIEHGSNIEIAVKICCLVEKSPHLKTVFEQLVYLVEKIKQLDVNNRYKMYMTNMPENTKNNYMYTMNSLEQLNGRITQKDQQQHNIPVWPTMLQPTNLKQAHGYPYFSLNCFGYDHLEMIATSNKHSYFELSKTLSNLTVISQEMDGAIMKWLHYLKLHKYQWFFIDLSYLEIEFIDEDNIEGFIAKVNKNSITKGAQKKICISTKALRDRQHKFKDLLMALDLEITPYELCEFMNYMRDILNYPIPNRNCVVDDQLQQDIVLIMEKSLIQLIEKLYITKYLVANSLLGTSVNKYLECTMLISANQIFMSHQISRIVFFSEKLKNVVHQMPKNFNSKVFNDNKN